MGFDSVGVEVPGGRISLVYSVGCDGCGGVT